MPRERAGLAGKLDMCRVDLSKLARESVSLMQSIAGDRSIELRLEIDEAVEASLKAEAEALTASQRLGRKSIKQGASRFVS